MSKHGDYFEDKVRELAQNGKVTIGTNVTVRWFNSDVEIGADELAQLVAQANCERL